MSKALTGYLIFSALVAGFLISLGAAFVIEHRTPIVPEVVLHAPATGDLPAPNQIVEVRYGWGCAYARYLKGDTGRDDIWLKYDYLEDGYVAAEDLLDLYGLPIYWWTPPAIPDGYKCDILSKVNAE
jgi:hypothetical protein